ncbi:hypothetical protein OG394_03260 [Kribbella sp. NBC_01245]|uniref:hypothetical protein n=1 Tax=Kribbella sp. NBC_01245 TaxID=2903578 RepID=UPI002E2B901F|nr:hypothetical protein [Kribbella sp. NBC_01245]
MKIKDEPLDDFEAALADVADVPDWRAVWGPRAGGGPSALAELRERVLAATGWSAEPVSGDADMRQTGWSFTTPRGSLVVVGADTASFAISRGGWSAYRLSQEDYPEALRILQHQQWPRYLELVRGRLGEPTYVGSCVDPGFPTEEWQDEYDARQVGYLAVWRRPGLEFHLYASHAGLEFDPKHPAMSVQHRVRSRRGNDE